MKQIKYLFYGLIFIIVTIFVCEFINDNRDIKTSFETSETRPAAKIANKNSNYSIGYIEKSACWVEKYSDIKKLADALMRSDEEYLRELVKTGKVHIMDKKTSIEISDSINEGVAMIYFREGKYTGKWGYTLKTFAHK